MKTQMSRIVYGNIALAALVTTLLGCSPGPDLNVSTHHNDNFRTGAYLAETKLTPKAVRDRGMHVRFWLNRCDTFIAASPPGNPVGCFDGTIETQPLFVHQQHFKIAGGPVEVTDGGLFVATAHNKVYGLIAATGQQMWATDLMFDKNHQPLNSGFDPRGVNSTPVIDAANNRMYVLFSNRLSSNQPWQDCTVLDGNPRRLCDFANYNNANSKVTYWLAMINLSNGNIEHEIPVSGFATNSDGKKIELDGKNQMDHPALLLDHGFVYVSLGSIAMFEGLTGYDFHGWVLRYTSTDLGDPTVFCTSCNDSPATVVAEGGSGIWQGGGGLTADNEGNIYFLTGNGRADFDATPKHQSFGDSIIKLAYSGQNAKPTVFAPPDAAALASTDADLGSGGAMIIPNSTSVIGGGKTGIMYVLDRSSMKRVQDFAATTNNYNPALRGQDWHSGPHLHGSPSFWRSADANFGNAYVWGEKDVLKLYRFSYATGLFETTPDPNSGRSFVTPFRKANVQALETTMPGGMVSLSANGNTKHSGIVWATLPDSDCPPLFPTCPTPRPVPPYSGHLYSFDAETLEPLWDTSFGMLAHWVPPTIAEGKVFIAEGSQIFPDYGGMLIAYELGNDNGTEKQTKPPYQPHPFGEESCQNSCHAERHTLDLLKSDQATHHLYPNGAAIQGNPMLAHTLIAPPRGHKIAALLEGNGEVVYEAIDNGQHHGLQWRLKSTNADLATINAQAGSKERHPTIKVRISPDDVWSASDGSSVTTNIDKIASSPQTTDIPWLLYKTVKSEGNGVLKDVNYIQRVYTHAGNPPRTLPKRVGEQASIPYHAVYWLYR